MIDPWPLDGVLYFDITTHDPGTGSIVDADSTPTFDVYENAVDTGMLGATNFTKRTSLTGDYRGTATTSAANGFEVGKCYNVIASATVSGITAKKNCGTFRIVPAETAAGVAKVDVTHAVGTAWASGAITSGVFAAGAITATSIAADAITAAKVADGTIDAATFAASAITATAFAADCITAAKIATGAIDADALATDAANEIADALLDRAAGVETSYTVRQAMRLMLAALAGKLSGAATNTVTVRDINDTKDRIVASVDGSGNRTAVTPDVS